MTNSLSGQSSSRLASIDAYRGAVMLLMMAEFLRFCSVAQAFPDSRFWQFLCWHESHVEWAGCSLHDLIAPGFLFIVGVALPFSIASRRARGEPFQLTARHAFMRSAILVVLGIVILSVHPKQIIWKFEDTLTQIGLGYPCLFLLAYCRPRDRWISLAVILIGYWLFFATYPLPAANFDYSSVGISKEWLSSHGLSGFAAHWQKNTNPAAKFDLWFLNLFPQHDRYMYAPKGLTTLNFIPSLATMILGLCAGDIMRNSQEPWSRVRQLVIVGAALLAVGLELEFLGICPIVKSLWTPSWVLFSGGLSFLALTSAYVLTDIWKLRKPAFPLIVVGTNSIAAYCLTHFFQAFAFHSLRRIFGWDTFGILGAAFDPLVYGAAVLACLWLVLFAMYRLKIFVRI